LSEASIFVEQQLFDLLNLRNNSYQILISHPNDQSFLMAVTS